MVDDIKTDLEVDFAALKETFGYHRSLHNSTGGHRGILGGYTVECVCGAKWVEEASTKKFECPREMALDDMERDIIVMQKRDVVLRVLLSRVSTALYYLDDVDGPKWDGLSGAQSARVSQVVSALVPVDGELTPYVPLDADTWDALYRAHPVNAYISDYEERLGTRANTAETQIRQVETYLQQCKDDGTTPETAEIEKRLRGVKK